MDCGLVAGRDLIGKIERIRTSGGILGKQMSSSVIVTDHLSSCIRACLAPLMKMADVEVVVVDNDSKDGTVTEVGKTFPAVTLIALKDDMVFGCARQRCVEILLKFHLDN